MRIVQYGFVCLFLGFLVVAHVQAAPSQKVPPKKKNADAKVNLEMVLIPAGTFMMGSPPDEKYRSSEETLHQVTITRPFYMSKYEITQEQWYKVMGNYPNVMEKRGGRYPVENLNWWQALAFTNALSRREGKKECYRLIDCTESPYSPLICQNVKFAGLSCSGYRLPTEAEWEYAARAGTTTPYSTGEWISTEQANFDGDCQSSRKHGVPLHTMEVGSYPPNPWGLYDMHGNVYEMVWDSWSRYPESAVKDPVGPEKHESLMIRGGCYWHSWSACRSAARGSEKFLERYGNIGFRVVRTAKKSKKPSTKK